MTDVEVRPAPDVGWRPRGHPVRWLLVLVATVALASVMSIWFGALAPRLDIQVSRWEAEPSRGEGALLVEVLVTNRAHAAVTVETGAWRRQDGIDLDAADRVPIDIAPGQTVAIVLHYRVLDCALARRADLAGPLGVRTPLGLPRAAAPRDVNVDALISPVCPLG